MAMHAKVVDIIITIIIMIIIMHVKVVDVFLVQESNFTNSGEGRPLEMLKKLEGGWLEEHLEKLVYLLRLLVVVGCCCWLLQGHQVKFVFLLRTEMPAGGFEDGKQADADMRRELSRKGLGRFRHSQHFVILLWNNLCLLLNDFCVFKVRSPSA